jgi:hypothetical protein
LRKLIDIFGGAARAGKLFGDGMDFDDRWGGGQGNELVLSQTREKMFGSARVHQRMRPREDDGVADKIETEQFAATGVERFIEEAFAHARFVGMTADAWWVGAVFPVGQRQTGRPGGEEWKPSNRLAEPVLKGGDVTRGAEFEEDLAGVAGVVAAAEFVVERQHQVIGAVQMPVIWHGAI